MPSPEAPGVLRPLPHHLAPVQQDRPEAHLGQQQSGEQAARADPDHDGSPLVPVRRAGDEAVGCVRGRPNAHVPGAAGKGRGLVGQLDIGGIDHQDRRLAAGIMGTADHGNLKEVLRHHAQALADGPLKVLGGMAQGQAKFGQAEHGGAYITGFAAITPRPGAIRPSGPGPVAAGALRPCAGGCRPGRGPGRCDPAGSSG